MKRGLLSLTMTGALCSVASLAFAGAYGAPEQPEERPMPPPAPRAAVVEEVEEDTLPLRRWDGFATDAETSRGLWIEIGTMYLQEDDVFDDLDYVDTQLRIAYGQEMFEAGAEIGYNYYDEDNPDFDDDNVTDLDIWLKAIPLRTDIVNVGGGVVFSFPTGGNLFQGISSSVLDNHAGVDDEYGFNPFVTAGFAAGPVQIRTSLGYRIYTDSDVPNNEDPYDGLDYNAAILAPIGDMVVVRAEFQGYHLTEEDYPNDVDDPVAVLPGVDIRLPLGGGEFLIRPTGLVGLTNETPDWGVGLSLAFTGIGG